jgi:hypothetical protein
MCSTDSWFEGLESLLVSFVVKVKHHSSKVCTDGIWHGGRERYQVIT